MTIVTRFRQPPSAASPGKLRRFGGTTLCATFAAALGCCTRPSIDVADYRHLRADPCEAVRFFQLAVELGSWEDAAGMLVVEDREVSWWELWIASDTPVRELGGLSLNQIIVGTHFVQLTDTDERVGRAVVFILSHPTPEIDQGYDLILEKREGLWFLNLDRTFELNQRPAAGP